MPIFIESGIYWTIQEIADELGVWYQKVYRDVERGGLVVVRTNRGPLLVSNDEKAAYMRRMGVSNGTDNGRED